MTRNFTLSLVLFYILAAFCLFINFQEYLLKHVGLGGPVAGVDEAFAAMAFIIGPLCIRKKKDQWVLYFLLFPIASVVYGLIVSFLLFSSKRTEAVLLQSLENSKLFLYFVIFYSVGVVRGWRIGDFQRIFFLCIGLSLVGAFANLVSPSHFEYTEYSYQIERSRVVGFQYKPNDLAILFAFAFVFYLFSFTKKTFTYFLMPLMLVLIILSTSRTAFFLCFAGVIFWLLVRRKRLLMLAGFAITLLVIPIIFDQLAKSFFVTETISNFSEFSSIETSQYIRFIMVYYGFILGIKYFPFGVGPGQFGTVMSDDSPVYQMLGLSDLGFFQTMEGVYDSNIASILGEYGFIGIVIYYVLSRRIFDGFYYRRKLMLTMLMVFALIISFLQPLYSYQVNSINFLLFIFSLRENDAIKKQRDSELYGLQ